MKCSHTLKIDGEYFYEILTGNKKAEFRKDDGHGFRRGEVIRLRETIWLNFDPAIGEKQIAKQLIHTRREALILITDVTIVNEIYKELPREPKFVMLSFDLISVIDLNKGIFLP
ncbi:DUF3850 domain-containing protein [Shewanella sp.]|uniref:DUF3850 domain-containing protein n=1 Tax=Shewanella sp. TaxID=50422 RepID=UPI001B56A645|nr:DUF3850 domain-containing protein [Shewanella sp.]MBP6518701.1 DUF3850 domain-containing protein [Shewanella sp.]